MTPSLSPNFDWTAFAQAMTRATTALRALRPFAPPTPEDTLSSSLWTQGTVFDGPETLRSPPESPLVLETTFQCGWRAPASLFTALSSPSSAHIALEQGVRVSEARAAMEDLFARWSAHPVLNTLLKCSVLPNRERLLVLRTDLDAQNLFVAPGWTLLNTFQDRAPTSVCTVPLAVAALHEFCDHASPAWFDVAAGDWIHRVASDPELRRLSSDLSWRWMV